MTLGLALRAIIDRRFRIRVPVGTSLLAFGALNFVILLSFLANFAGGNGQQVWLNTQYFLAHSILIVAIFVLLPERNDWGIAWAWAFGAVAVVLAATRLLELVGVPLHEIASFAGMSILGDTQDPSSWNLYSVFLIAALALLLEERFARWEGIGYACALVVVVALASAESRTTLVIFFMVIAWLLWIARSRRRRAMYVALAIAFLAASVSPLSGIASKTLIVTSPAGAGARVDPSTIRITAPGPVTTPPTVSEPVTTPPSVSAVEPVPKPGPPPNLRPDWRSVLDRSAYRLEQVVDAPVIDPAGGNYLELLVRAGGTTDRAALQITIDGGVVKSLREAEITQYFGWVVVPLPRDALAHRPLVVGFQVTGSPDSESNYFALGGIDALAEGVTSRIWTGSHMTEDDLSSDPGVQRGVVLAFVNGQVPPYHRFTPTSGPVLDPSVQDRFTLWRTALAIFAAHPLLGTGFYTFESAQTPYLSGPVSFQQYANAHSNYLELLADLGLLGPLLFGLALVAAMSVAVRRAVRPTRTLDAALAAALGAFVVSSLTQTWIADSRIYMFAWAILLVSVRTVESSVKFEPSLQSEPLVDSATGR